MCASSSSPSISRGPGREKYADAFTATTRLAPQARQLRGVRQRLRMRARGVVSAWHHHHDLRLAGRHLLPGRRPRRFTGQPQHVLAAGQLDQLRRPVARHIHGIEPLQGGHPRPRLSPHGELHAVDPRGGPRHQLDALLATAGRLGDRAHVSKRLAQRLRIERNHPRAGRQLARQLRHLLVGHRANGTQGLRHDQIGRQGRDGRAVELVYRLAPRRPLAHGRIDLARAQTTRQHIPRHPREPARPGRVVALVRHPHHLVLEAQREQQLSRVGNEAHDSHTRDCTPTASALISPQR